MKRALLAAAVALVIAACGKVTQENFARLTEGMPEQEVRAILGEPTESSSLQVLGVSGTSSKWATVDAVITVQFANGKLRLKSFAKTAPK